MTKVVILGSNGQLGHDLVKVLTANRDCQVAGLTRTDIDANEVDACASLQQHSDADYIINCIAMTNVDGCEDNPEAAFQINSAFVVRLAKFCSMHDIVLVQISTDYVLDGMRKEALTEAALANPLNVYGLSKYAGEIAVRNNCSKYFILRVGSLFGVAGASGKGGNFVNTMLRLAQEQDSWKVIDDQFSCPTHTLDVARAVNQLIAAKVTNYGLYNCVSSSSCNWYDFARKILELSGLDKNKVKPVSYQDYQFKAKRPQYGILDCKKLGAYYAMPAYQDALQEYLRLQS